MYSKIRSPPQEQTTEYVTKQNALSENQTCNNGEKMEATTPQTAKIVNDGSPRPKRPGTTKKTQPENQHRFWRTPEEGLGYKVLSKKPEKKER